MPLSLEVNSKSTPQHQIPSLSISEQLFPGTNHIALCLGPSLFLSFHTGGRVIKLYVKSPLMK